jgi:hypothetical protein
MATWSTLIALLSLHLATNYAAVRAVSMRCLNRQRANIVLSSIMQQGKVLSPSDVSKRERVFEKDGALRWSDDEIVGYCKIGVSLQALLSRVALRKEQTGSLALRAVHMSDFLSVFANEAYILWPGTSSDYEALIVLKHGCTPIDQLKAWAHALSLAEKVRGRHPGGEQDDDDDSTAKDRLAELRRTLEDTRALFENFTDELRDKGWDLDVVALETRPGTRAQIETHN